jgi:predicted alpha/beta-fold hydrolase
VRWSGHIWTIGPHLLAGRRVPERGRTWSGEVLDPQRGTIPLSGVFVDRTDSDRAVILQHGLGGSADSVYLRESTQMLWRAGYAVLRPSMRGADESGADLYHAGLTADLHAVLASPELRRFAEIYVIGYSMGGHLALGLAHESADARLKAVAAVCAPLDLAAAARAIDAPRSAPYRHHVLRSLKRGYAHVAERGPHPTAWADVRRARTIREWDRVTVVPRFGFRDVDDYYERASAGPKLDALRVPTLIVSSRNDPMVPEWTVAPSLERGRAGVWTRWTDRGGHVGFPSDLDLGFSAPRGLERQIAGWFGSLHR